MRRKSLLAVAVCTAALTGASASAALAGEVIGPPGTPGVAGSGSGIATGAVAHANSICAFSGLNDFILGEGPIDFIVQSPGQDVRTGETPPGIPGLACRGGSNPHNPPSP
jgi:opacity protein-like surface antigen